MSLNAVCTHVARGECLTLDTPVHRHGPKKGKLYYTVSRSLLMSLPWEIF